MPKSTEFGHMLRCCSLILVLVGTLLSPSVCAQVEVTRPEPNLELTNGNWFNGRSFQYKTVYSVNGRLTFRRPAHIDRTIDLHQGFVVPPFAEAHNHNVEGLNNLDTLIASYLRHGIFYVKNPNNLARDRDVLLARLDRPDCIDVSFSNGAFTGSGGHPLEIPERLIRTGRWKQADAEGGFFYTVDNAADLEKKWPDLLSTNPDFVKSYLLYSDEYARRRDDPHFYAWKGLDPALLPLIVKKAHAAGLRVSAHVEDAADFHNALIAGVDEVNHMPGFRFEADVEQHPISQFEITEADAERAARQGTYVVTTLAGTDKRDAAQNQLNARNLGILLKHHVHLALGSDSYRSDTLPEALYLNSLHLLSRLQLLNLWCTSTVETIFPGRKVGQLKEGFEASFLVLADNPLKNFSAVEKITLEVKQGHVL
jgi:hypothetical protein